VTEELEALRALVEARRTLPAPEARRRLREAAGVSLSALGAVLGITAKAMAGLERAAIPAEEFAVAYSQALKVLEPPEVLTGEELEQYATLFREHPCLACGGVHPEVIATDGAGASPAACPRVRRVAYDSSKRVTEMEFWPENRWSRDGIVFPDILKEAAPPT
jgi:transcriptional regulator with XRE-family HTH domain